MAILSVIVPVHNTAPYLKKSVDSIRNQTLKDLEIILVENLSTDGSSEMCDEIAQIDSRIKVLHIQIADLSTARNEGIKVASAPYVGFIDSDDHIDPEMYESMLNALKVNNAEMVYCNLKYESEDGELIDSVSDTGLIQVKPGMDALRDIFRGKLDSSFCSKLFKKDLFITVSFPEGYLFEDHSTIYKIVNLCHTVVHIDCPYYHYVQRDNSITHEWVFKKYYHHFLADYGRLEFIHKHRIFEPDEHKENMSRLVGACLILFRDGQLVAQRTDMEEFVPTMKKKLKKLLTVKDEMDSKKFRRLKKMIYYTPLVRLFYKIRYKISNKTMERPFIKKEK